MISDSSPATIMIIDDEPDNLNVLGVMLRQKGWNVRAFPRGKMALVAAADERPDLVLLDIRMPEMDGYEVCRLFKADERLRSIPIIFLSAFSEPSDKVRAFAAGGVDYVTKPFAEIEVLARSETHLQLHRHQFHLEELVHQRVRELAEANRRLSIWEDAKNEWLNTISHEMRTPLVGVLGITELLFLELPPASDLQSLRESYEVSCRRINKLIDDAMLLTRIDVGSEDFKLSYVRLADILRNAMDALGQEVPECPVQSFLTDVDQVTVSGEAELLTQAFTDLLKTAACCVCGKEPLTVVAHVGEGQANVSISTGGEGLAPGALETFFDVGGQRTLLKNGGDFGLGSALASRILRLFNGKVSIRNAAVKGLILESSLPIAQGAER
jgi:two-component system sensor histidine kinase/response regulator